METTLKATTTHSRGARARSLATTATTTITQAAAIGLGLLAAAGAQAQAGSSVQLFGLMDIGVQALKASGTDTRHLVNSDGNTSSRFGVRGVG